MTTKKLEIIGYIKDKGLVTAGEIAKVFSIGGAMTHRHLKSLVESGKLIKQGTPPKVYYSIAKVAENYSTEKGTGANDKINNKSFEKIIEENFLLLTPDGKEIFGVDGFVKWCSERNYDVDKKAEEYTESLDEYNQFKIDGFIDATIKIKTTFGEGERFLDKLFYLHPYSIPVFGKTKIAQWLFHAKQTQNKMLMKKVLQIIEPEIGSFVKKYKPDAIAFVPPTVPRNIQLMKELQNGLKINLNQIVVEKIKTPIMIQQKSLKEVKDRIKNAESTMHVIGNNQKYKKLLIIDDFTGSGSTLNVIAKKCKNQNIAKEIIGLTITGSMNGFEVIREI